MDRAEVILAFITDVGIKMDETPFFTFSMDDIRRTDPAVLERFAKSSFDIDLIIAEAGRLKLQSQLRIEPAKEFASPSKNSCV